jgi:flagellin
MVSPINNNLTGLVFESTNNNTDLENIVSKLSSGKKNLRVGEDSGSHSQGTKLSSKNIRDIANVQNLQNFLSFTQSQDGVLEQVGKILHRMDELATRALDITATDGDRENYNKEFIELADQLSKFSREKFGDINLFGGGTAGIDYIKGTAANDFNYAQNVQNIGTNAAGSTDTGSILGDDVTGNGILNDSSVVNNTNDATPLSYVSPVQDEDGNATGTGGGVITADGQALMDNAVKWIKDTQTIVNSAYGWTIDTGDTWKLQINENGQAGGWAAVVWGYQGNVDRMEIDLPDATSSGIEFDRVIAHEMVHVMQHQNTYSSDPTGDGSSRATWLSEGLAEFIHGSDERVYGILGNDPSDDDIRNLTNAIGNGNEDWTANDQYAAAYLAVRFLDSEIKSSSYTGAGTTNFNVSDGIRHMTEWMKEQKAANAGAANSGLNAYISTFLGDKEYSNNEEFINYFKGATEMNVAIDGDGSTYKSKAVSSITISDTTSYNLTSIEKAKDTLTFLSTKLTDLAEQRSLAGANMSRVQNELQNLAGKISTGEMAVSRIEDADIAQESSNYASSQVRTQASIAILAQAKQLNVGVSDLLRGVNIGG